VRRPRYWKVLKHLSGNGTRRWGGRREGFGLQKKLLLTIEGGRTKEYRGEFDGLDWEGMGAE